MKTFKIFLKDYETIQLSANNFAVDDQNNLVVGDNLFNKDDWKRITYLYDNSVGQYDYNLDQPYADANMVPSTWIDPYTINTGAASGL